jgi:hypothetical protein
MSDGALIAPSDRVLESGPGYYLVHPPRKEYREKLRPDSRGYRRLRRRIDTRINA